MTIEAISDFLWCGVFIPLLILSSAVLTVKCRALQITRLPRAIRKAFSPEKTAVGSGNPGRVSPFQAASTALASTIGTGNIIGTAQAIAMGGPGALFWLWVAAFAGMIVKYAEVMFAVYFRCGSLGYGPMDYISRGIGSESAAKLYAVLALFSAFTMGNIVQVNSITDSLCVSAEAFGIFRRENVILLRALTAMLLSSGVLVFVSGAAERIGKVSELLLPFMTGMFIFVCIYIMLRNAERLLPSLRLVFQSAFSLRPAAGAAVGKGTAACIQWGFRRGAFSNEAGLGTSAIAHACAKAEAPAEHGLWGLFEVFADTIVICTCTALVILSSGVTIAYGEIVGGSLFTKAVAEVFGVRFASVFITLTITLFAYSSVIAWCLYGKRCAVFTFGEGGGKIFSVIFPILTALGCFIPVRYVWLASDLANAVMSVPNMISLILLSPLAGELSFQNFTLTKKK